MCTTCSAAPRPPRGAESGSPGVGFADPRAVLRDDFSKGFALLPACVVPMTLIVVLGFCLIERKARRGESSLGFYLDSTRSRSAGKSLARPLDLCLHRSSRLYLLLYIWPQSSKSLKHANNFKHGSSPYEPEDRSHAEYTHGAVGPAPLSPFLFPRTPHRTGLCTVGSSPSSLPPPPPPLFPFPRTNLSCSGIDPCVLIDPRPWGCTAPRSIGIKKKKKSFYFLFNPEKNT